MRKSIHRGDKKLPQNYDKPAPGQNATVETAGLLCHGTTWPGSAAYPIKEKKKLLKRLKSRSQTKLGSVDQTQRQWPHQLVNKSLMMTPNEKFSKETSIWEILYEVRKCKNAIETWNLTLKKALSNQIAYNLGRIWQFPMEVSVKMSIKTPLLAVDDKVPLVCKTTKIYCCQ